MIFSLIAQEKSVLQATDSLIDAPFSSLLIADITGLFYESYFAIFMRVGNA